MSLFKTQDPLYIPHKSFSFIAIFTRTLISSSSSQTTHNKNKKPLSVLFDEVVGLSEKAENESEGDSNDELKNGLKELERELRHLKAESKKRSNLDVNVEAEKTKNVKAMETTNVRAEGTKNVKSLGLYSLFVDKRREKEEKKATREEEPSVFKEISPEMEMFVSHLYKEGYFKKANFLPGDKKILDFRCFNNSFSRNFIKFAAYQYGKDHQELAKWLSGSDLKKVALFGCPSLSRKNVFAAKELRNYFDIQEGTVCCKCALKDSCQFVNQLVWKGQNKNLNLAIVMRVITLYALESVPPELDVPNEVKASVSRLLKEIINLSQNYYGMVPVIGNKFTPE